MADRPRPRSPDLVDPPPLSPPLVVPGASPRRADGAAAWLFAAAVLLSPLAMAPAARPLAAAVDALLAAGVAACAAGLARARAAPRVPPVLVGCAAWLLAQGWWMALNAHGTYDPAGPSFRPVRPLVTGLPGAADGPEAVRVMTRVTLLLAAACAASRLAAVPRYRRRLLLAVAAAGAAVAVLGAAGRAVPGAAADVAAHEPHEGTPFATFNYHGNAGAFVNLCLPAALALLPPAAGGTAEPGRRRRASRWRFWSATAAGAAAAVLNVSKASLPIAAAVVAATAWVALRPAARRAGAAPPAGGRPWRRAAVAAVAAVALAAAAATAIRVGGQGDRWAEYLRQPTPTGGRGLLWRVVADMAAEAGPWGGGPGSYKLLFPLAARRVPQLYSKFIVTVHVPGGRVSMWSQAHQDYLQAVVEWGWVGAAAAGVVFFGALARGLTLLRREPRPGPGDAADAAAGRRDVAAAAIALSGVAAHAALDFPLQVLPVQVVAAVYVGLLWGTPAPPHGRAR